MRPVGLAAVSGRCARAAPAGLVLAAASPCRPLPYAYRHRLCRHSASLADGQHTAAAAAAAAPHRSSRRERTLAYLRSLRSSSTRSAPARRFHNARPQRQQQSTQSAQFTQSTQDQDPASALKEALASASPPENDRFSRERVRDWALANRQRRLMRRKLIELAREKNAPSAPIHVIGSDPRATYIAHHLSRKPGGNPVCLILPTNGARLRWHDEGSRVTLLRGDRVTYSKDVLVEFLNISKHLMEDVRDDPSRDPRVHARIYYLVVTLACRSTVRSLERLAHRIGPWTTVCLIQNGLGVAELLNRTVFRGRNRAPNYVLGHMSHDLGYDTDKWFTVRELAGGVLRLAAYMPVGSHPDRKQVGDELVDATPRWGEHEHRLQRRLWKPEQLAIPGGAHNWRHRRPYRRSGGVGTSRPQYIGQGEGVDETIHETTDETTDETDDWEEAEVETELEDADTTTLSSNTTAKQSRETTTTTTTDVNTSPSLVYEVGETHPPQKYDKQAYAAYTLARRRRHMLSLDATTLNAPKILAQSQPRYKLITLLTTAPNLCAGRYSLYSVYRHKLPEMVYAAAFEPVATVLQLPLSRSMWASPTVRAMLLGIVDELIAVIAWLPETRKSHKLLHDIKAGTFRRRVISELYARTGRVDMAQQQQQNLMGYPGHDGGYYSRALGYRQRGAVVPPVTSAFGGGREAAHNVMEQLVAAGMTTDIQFLNGFFVRRGQQIGIACPQNTMIMRMLDVRLAINRAQARLFVPMVGNAYLNSGESPSGRRARNRPRGTTTDGVWRSAKGEFASASASVSAAPSSKSKLMDPEVHGYSEFDLLDGIPRPLEAEAAAIPTTTTSTGRTSASAWDAMPPEQADQALRRYYQKQNERGDDDDEMNGEKDEHVVLQRDKHDRLASEITLRLRSADEAQEAALQHLDRYLHDELYGEAPPVQQAQPLAAQPPPKKKRSSPLVDPNEPAEPDYSNDDDDAYIAQFYSSTPTPDNKVQSTPGVVPGPTPMLHTARRSSIGSNKIVPVDG